ncbi:MAG: hypothetical protein WB524_05960 [Acidobacteriaceae bacterium]|jgi:hypothetical protein
MTSNLRSIALAALVAVASLSQTLHAQSDLIHSQVTVPFSFDYGKAHFGQGTYVINMIDQNVLSIRTVEGKTTMVMAQLSFEPSAAKSSVVTFKKYGDRYFLEEVSIAGSDAHVSVYESQAEKHAARELAMRGQEATQVALALLPQHPFGN